MVKVYSKKHKSILTALLIPCLKRDSTEIEAPFNTTMGLLQSKKKKNTEVNNTHPMAFAI